MAHGKYMLKWLVKAGVLTISENKENGATLATIDRAKYPAEIQQNLTDYGFKQVMSDRTNTAATPADRVKQARELDAQFLRGEWIAEGTRTAPVVSVLAEAIAEIKGCSIADAQRALAKQDDKAKDALRQNPKVKAVIERLEKERKASDGVELGDLLTA